jgi:hypothetical protein
MSNRTIDRVPLALLETIEQTWRQADEFSAKANEAINDGLWELRTFLAAPAVQTNSSGHAHCPHCAVCHTAEETCVQALRRVLALYERTEHGTGGASPLICNSHKTRL